MQSLSLRRWFLVGLAIDLIGVIVFATFIALLLLMGCAKVHAQCGSGGCRVIPTNPPMGLVQTPPTYRSPRPCDAQAAAMNPNLTAEPVGQAPGPEWKWEHLPNVGWGWVQHAEPSKPSPTRPTPAKCPKSGCDCSPCECGPACECGPDRPKVGQLPGVIPGGIDWSKCPTADRDYYDVCGKVSTYEHAQRLIGEDLADDSAKPWLLLKGMDSKPVPAGLTDKCRVIVQPASSKVYAGYPNGVTLQAVNGRELLHLDTYTSADELTQTISAKLSEYDPAKDPGAGKPYPWPEKDKPATPTEPTKIPTNGYWLLVATGALVYFLFVRR